MTQTAFRIGGVLVAATMLACGSDNSTEPGLALAGTYSATQWVTTGGTGQTNQLNAGSTLNITLNSNGTTTGHLHVAASGGNPAFDADMAGTWAQSGNTVTFSQTADTFVRNMSFDVVPSGAKWALVGDHVFASSSTRVQLTLTQS
ncbi:MAG TPA: hypothetical protein VF105_07590 [Gemmatimonadaceae bacterium]